jgi:hypothetical protein
VMLSVLAGHRRYAHVTSCSQCDGLASSGCP